MRYNLAGLLIFLVSLSTPAHAWESRSGNCSIQFYQAAAAQPIIYTVDTAAVSFGEGSETFAESDGRWQLYQDISIAKSPNLNNFRVKLSLQPSGNPEYSYLEVTMLYVKRDFPHNVHTSARYHLPARGGVVHFFLEENFGPPAPIFDSPVMGINDFAPAPLISAKNPGFIVSGSCSLGAAGQ